MNSDRQSCASSSSRVWPAANRRWRTFCCPWHFATAALPDESGAHPPFPDRLAPAPPSLSDQTPQQPSEHCRLRPESVAGLFEPVGADRLLVFRNATVLTMDGSASLAAHDVVVRNQRIESVRPTGAELPQDAVVVEAAGKTLLPGLADMHGHLFLRPWVDAVMPLLQGNPVDFVLPYELQLFQLLACGVTRLEVMAGCPDGLWLRDCVERGAMVGPRLTIGSPLIDGPPAIHSTLMSYVVADREGGQRAARLIAERGYDFAKPYSNLPQAGYAGLVDECHRLNIRLVGHVPRSVGIEAAVASGQQVIAHAAELFYNDARPKRTDVHRRAALIDLVARQGVWLHTTVTVCARIEWVGGSRPLTSPDEQYMHPVHRTLWRDDSPMVAAVRGRPERGVVYDEVFDLACQTVKAAAQAGVKLVAGTDFPNPHVVDGYSLHEELQTLVDHCALSPMDALRCCTRLAAEYDRRGPGDGMVAVGGAADLVLLDADPQANIAATRQVDTVVVRGQLLRRAAIEEGKRRIAAAYAAMPQPQLRSLPA